MLSLQFPIVQFHRLLQINTGSGFNFTVDDVTYRAEEASVTEFLVSYTPPREDSTPAPTEPDDTNKTVIIVVVVVVIIVALVAAGIGTFVYVSMRLFQTDCTGITSCLHSAAFTTKCQV